MNSKSLGEIEASIDQLDWPDQVRLLEYLAPRIAKAVRKGQAPVEPSDQAAIPQRPEAENVRG